MNRGGNKRRMDDSLTQLMARLRATEEWLHDDQLAQILSCGREAVPALESILRETIQEKTGLERRFPALNSDWLAPVHALFLLAHLESESSLDIVIEFLGQPPVELDGWIPDMASEDLWEVFYLLGRRQIKQLAAFIRNQKANEFTRLAVCTALIQIGLNNPKSRSAVVDAFKGILTDDDLDSEFMGLIVSELMDLKDEDLQSYMLNAIKNYDIWPGIISVDEVLQGFGNKRVRRLHPLDIYERFRMLRGYTHFAYPPSYPELKKKLQFDFEKFF